MKKHYENDIKILKLDKKRNMLASRDRAVVPNENLSLDDDTNMPVLEKASKINEAFVSHDSPPTLAPEIEPSASLLLLLCPVNAIKSLNNFDTHSGPLDMSSNKYILAKKGIVDKNLYKIHLNSKLSSVELDKINTHNKKYEVSNTAQTQTHLVDKQQEICMKSKTSNTSGLNAIGDARLKKNEVLHSESENCYKGNVNNRPSCSSTSRCNGLKSVNVIMDDKQVSGGRELSSNNNELGKQDEGEILPLDDKPSDVDPVEAFFPFEGDKLLTDCVPKLRVEESWNDDYMEEILRLLYNMPNNIVTSEAMNTDSSGLNLSTSVLGGNEIERLDDSFDKGSDIQNETHLSEQLATLKADNMDEVLDDRVTDIFLNGKGTNTECTVGTSGCCSEIFSRDSEEPIVEVAEAQRDESNKESMTGGTLIGFEDCPEVLNVANEVTLSFNGNYLDNHFNDGNEELINEGTVSLGNYSSQVSMIGCEEPVIDETEATGDNSTNVLINVSQLSSTERSVDGTSNYSGFLSTNNEEYVAEVNKGMDYCSNKQSFLEENPNPGHLFSNNPAHVNSDYALTLASIDTTNLEIGPFNLYSQRGNVDGNEDKALLNFAYSGCIMNKSASSLNSSINAKQVIEYPEVPVESSEQERVQPNHGISSKIGEDNSTDGVSRVSYSPGPSSPTHSVASEELSTMCHNLDSFQSGPFISGLIFPALDLESAVHSKPTHTDPNGPSTSRYLPQSSLSIDELGYTQKSSEDDISNISSKDAEVTHDEAQSFIHEYNVIKDSEVVGNLALTSATNTKEIDQSLDLESADHSKPTHTDPNGPSTSRYLPQSRTDNDNTNEDIAFEVLNLSRTNDSNTKKGIASEALNLSSTNDPNTKASDSLDLESADTSKPTDTDRNGLSTSRYLPQSRTDHTNNNEIIASDSLNLSSTSDSNTREDIVPEALHCSMTNDENAKEGFALGPSNLCITNDPFIKENVAFKALNLSRTSIPDSSEDIAPKAVHLSSTNNPIYEDITSDSLILSGTNNSNTIEDIASETLNFSNALLPELGYTQKSSEDDISNISTKDSEVNHDEEQSFIHENNVKQDSEVVGNLAVTSATNNKEIEFNMDTGKLLNKDNSPIGKSTWMADASQEVSEMNKSEPEKYTPQILSSPQVLPLIHMEENSSEGGESHQSSLGDLDAKECNSEVEYTTKEPNTSNENSFAKKGEPNPFPYKTNEVHNNRNECNSHKSSCIKQTICKQISEEEQSSSNKDTEPLDVSLNNNINDIQIIAELETDASREVYEMNESEPPKCTPQNNISPPHVSPLLNMKDNYLEGAETLQNQFGDLGTKQCTSDVENTTNEPSTSNEMHENINECYTHESSYIKQDITNEISEREQLSSNEQIEPVEVSLHNNVNEIQPISEPETAVSREVCQVNESEVIGNLGTKKRGRPKKIQSLVGGDANDLNPSSEPEPSEETPQRILRSSSRVNIPFNMRNVSAKDLPKCEIQLTSINSIRSLKEIMKQNGVTKVPNSVLNVLLKKSQKLPKCEVKVPRINSFSHLMQIMNENGLTGDPSALRHMWNNSSVSNDELRKERVLGAAKHETSRYLRSSAKRKINEPTEKPNKRQHLDSSKPSTSHEVSVKQQRMTDIEKIHQLKSVISHYDSPDPSTSHGCERVPFDVENTMVLENNTVSGLKQPLSKICDIRKLDSVHSVFEQLIQPTLNRTNFDLNVNNFKQPTSDKNQSVLLGNILTEFIKMWKNNKEESTTTRFSEVPKPGTNPKTKGPCGCTLNDYLNDCSGCKQYYDTIINSYVLRSQISNADISKISQKLHRENNNFSLPTNNAVLSIPVVVRTKKRPRKASDKPTKRICIRNTNRQEPSQSLQSLPSTSTKKVVSGSPVSRPMRKCRARRRVSGNKRNSRMFDESTCPESSSSDDGDSDSSSGEV